MSMFIYWDELIRVEHLEITKWRTLHSATDYPLLFVEIIRTARNYKI